MISAIISRKYVKRQMNKKTLLWCILSIVLVAYLVVALSYTAHRAQNDLCAGVDIVVHDADGLGFITDEDISMMIGNEDNRFLSMELGEINTHEIETRLNGIDKIEHANCVIYNNGRLKIEVTPMVPLARIFDEGKSYYINQDGKKMVAEARYHVDVPIIVGHFDSTFLATSMLPLLTYIQADSVWNSFVSGIKVTPQKDIHISPMIKGHVIVFGDTSMMEDKFQRLGTIYKDVMPVKGWNYYDTISVKWRGQVVATRREKRKEPVKLSFADSVNEEAVSVHSMDVSRVASNTHASGKKEAVTGNEAEPKKTEKTVKTKNTEKVAGKPKKEIKKKTNKKTN